MSNFGAGVLRVVNPYEVAFRDARSAVGAEELLSRAAMFDNVADAVADCSLVVGTTAEGRRGPLHSLYPLPEAGGLIRNALAAGPVGLLFGSEKRGLLNEDLAHCHWLLTIPTGTLQPSMNLGQAVAVCLYELARVPFHSEQGQGGDVAETSSAAELERLTVLLVQALDVSGYILPGQAVVTEGNVRRLVRRLRPGREDCALMLGMLRQLLWKIRGVGEKP
jgi:TrmH family RNA methyltransferase